jgi:hypothetical protein
MEHLIRVRKEKIESLISSAATRHIHARLRPRVSVELQVRVESVDGHAGQQWSKVE